MNFGKVKKWFLITCPFLIVVIFFNHLMEMKVEFSRSQIDVVKSNKEDRLLIFDRRGELLSGTDTAPSIRALINSIDLKSLEEDEITLTIDGGLQEYTHEILRRFSQEYGYVGGAAVMMDVRTGELLSLVSYSVEENSDPALHKATTGLYAPGSTIKPFIALAALQEGVIDAEKEILSTGDITLENPFQPNEPFVYKDWRAHGYVDMRKALAMSSNVYFYTVGGGYGDQPGLGIDSIQRYLRLFGFGTLTGIELIKEKAGELPGPAQKLAEYQDEWRTGDTYLVSIGQHGYQITPLQMARGVAIIANGGFLLKPTLLAVLNNFDEYQRVQINNDYFKVIKEGMEQAVIEGTATALYLDGITVAAKTGTTEVGNERKYIHSWVTGFFPLSEPRYVFTVMLESGPRGEEVGAAAAMRDIFLWLRSNRTEYLVK